jgi:hypothetical protein
MNVWKLSGKSPSEPMRVCREKRFLFRRHFPLKRYVARRVAAEQGDHGCVTPGEVFASCMTCRVHQRDAAINVSEHFGMHQRHVEKLLFLRRQVCVPSTRDGILRERQRLGVLRKSACIIAEEIAAELIKDDNGGEQ